MLLVDDEELDLEGMKRFIPWAELGMLVAGSVNNALSACEILDRQPIDILVSDVNMPYMSGLELARIALERRPGLRIIFVSGFQEFSYVQQALSLKAYSYVLKPMDDSELVASLMKVKRDLDEERKRHEVEAAYRQMIPIAKNELLQRLLEGEDTANREFMSRLMQAHDLKQLHWPARVAVMELDAFARSGAGAGEAGASGQEISRAFLKLLHEALEPLGFAPSCKLNSNRVAVLLEAGSADVTASRILEAVRRSLPVTVTAGLGTSVDSLGQLHSSYRQAIQAVEGKMFLGKGGVIKYEEVSAEPGMLDARTLETHMNAVTKAMKDYDLVQVYDECENLFRSFSGLRSPFTVRNLTTYMIWKLDQFLSAMDENLFELLDIDILKLDIVMQFETIADIRSWLVHRIFEISERLHEKNNTKDGKFIRSVMKTIKERMGENITLKDIAQHFSFSPSYLGFLIKEKSGHTFNELLVQLRMERACELLKQPGMKVYEIADQVGYRYLPYFSRQFKEKFGMTPLEYRKKKLE
ncbi:response regulator [Paenibacillus soyae]|uniref:response regulator n=1 Tax=Paenibacillus soyae TaxID=2969249 RepID=UPI0035300E1B